MPFGQVSRADAKACVQDLLADGIGIAAEVDHFELAALGPVQHAGDVPLPGRFGQSSKANGKTTGTCVHKSAPWAEAYPVFAVDKIHKVRSFLHRCERRRWMV